MYDTVMVITCYVHRGKGFKWISFTINSLSGILLGLLKLISEKKYFVKIEVQIYKIGGQKYRSLMKEKMNKS